MNIGDSTMLRLDGKRFQCGNCTASVFTYLGAEDTTHAGRYRCNGCGAEYGGIRISTASAEGGLFHPEGASKNVRVTHTYKISGDRAIKLGQLRHFINDVVKGAPDDIDVILYVGQFEQRDPHPDNITVVVEEERKHDV